MIDEKRELLKKANHSRLLIVMVIDMSVGGLLAIVAQRTPFLTGLFAGLCGGVLVGFPAGLLTIVWYAYTDPERFMKNIKD